MIRKKRQYYFTVYECPEPNKTLVHYLYNNQFDGEYLLPEFRHLDFFWLLKGDPVSDDVYGGHDGIRQIHSGRANCNGINPHKDQTPGTPDILIVNC